MNKLIAALLLSLSLVGCATTHQEAVKPSVVVEYKYVTTPIPPEFLEIPGPVLPLDFSREPLPTQKDVSEWIVNTEMRSMLMEKNLKALKKHEQEQKDKLTK